MSLYSISLVLGILANQALAGCFPSREKPCPAPAPQPGPAPASPWLNNCPKGIPKTWTCLDPSIDFPTVDCIVADLKACGTLDNNRALLYSYGATTVEVRTKVRDKLEPRPIMFNDALPLDWDRQIMSVERFGLKQGKIADPDVNKRNDAFVNRFSAALTIAAKGEVILVVGSRNSKFGGSGAYSMPDPKTAKENVWRTYEFPLAQRNPDVTRVVSYALDEKPMNAVVDWEPGKKGELLPEPSFPDPPLHKMNAAPGPSKPDPGSSKPNPGSSRPAPGPLGPLDPEPSKPKPEEEPSRKPLRGPFRKPPAVRRQEFMIVRSNQ
ncbi:hypothetical protein K458DRAFT_402836 [Lentithecium fluviatile CBS 122367]|uniref:Uncharacterized protein n=1 Tax=Lentithecium fluviatile CBS 122367 TaxID=1168545 RepID=A0A6G1J755_9PLEO|nr:hypothetical protein K458DRAFT_402836 [Lentithecium fluviatile CBS 122367]